MRAHIGRSTGICSPPEASSEQRMAILIFTVGDHIDRSTGLSTLWMRHLVEKNSNFRYLLLVSILADQLADCLPIPIDTSSSKEW